MGGLHLYVTPAGGKLWRLRYEFERQGKLLSIGPYSVVGLADARAAATNAKRLVREGRDPAVEKRLRRLGVITDRGTRFEAIAREWHELNKGHWVEVHADDVLHSLECDVFRELGATPIKDIAPTHMLPCCEKLKTVPRLRPRDASGHACQQCLCTLLHRVEQRPIRRPSCRRR